MKVKDDNYVMIPGWVINRLNLKGNSLLIYSIIYGFCQDGDGCFHGSLDYLQEWTNSTRQSVINVLKELIDNNLIIKEESKPNNKYYVKKLYTSDSKETLQECKETLRDNVKNLYIDSKETLHNNIDNNKDNNINNNAPLPSFNSSSLKENSETNAAEWITPPDMPHNSVNCPYVFLSDNDRAYLRNKYKECYIPTIKALNKWNQENPEFRYAAGIEGFERYVMKQGLRQPRADGLSEGAVIARI